MAKRTVVALLALAAIATGLAACQSPKPATGPSGASGTASSGEVSSNDVLSEHEVSADALSGQHSAGPALDPGVEWWRATRAGGR